jgi:hypothetical protein
MLLASIASRASTRQGSDGHPTATVVGVVDWVLGDLFDYADLDFESVSHGPRMITRTLYWVIAILLLLLVLCFFVRM